MVASLHTPDGSDDNRRTLVAASCDVAETLAPRPVLRLALQKQHRSRRACWIRRGAAHRCARGSPMRPTMRTAWSREQECSLRAGSWGAPCGWCVPAPWMKLAQTLRSVWSRRVTALTALQLGRRRLGGGDSSGLGGMRGERALGLAHQRCGVESCIRADFARAPVLKWRKDEDKAEDPNPTTLCAQRACSRWLGMAGWMDVRSGVKKRRTPGAGMG